MRMILFLVFAVATQAQSAFDLSQAGFVAATVADVASSVGQIELNPVLGRGVFGPRQAVIKGGMTAALVISERWIVRRNPATKKAFTVINWVAASLMTSAAIHNSKD